MEAQFRQGDVFMKKINEIPEGVKPYPMEGKRYVLAHGEVTGHAHAIYETTDVEMYERDGVLYMKLDAPTTIKHEEHGPITLDEGIYSARIQREYTPEGIRNVID
jgi:hypothetical protein